MDSHKVAAIVLAAGKGTRMRSSLPKVMHPLGGRPMISHLMQAVGDAGIGRVVAVVGPDMPAVAGAVGDAAIAVQDVALGTGDAAKRAIPALADFDGTVLVLFGADPLVSVETLSRLIAARQGPKPPALVVLGFVPDDSGQYGRLVVDGENRLDRIVEYWDADEQTRAISLCNSGVLAADATILFSLLGRLENKNAKQEYYLTDVVGMARRDGHECIVVEGNPT